MKLVIPSPTDAAKIDREWPPKRSSHHLNVGWRWAPLLARSPERFALKRGDGGEIAGLWCSGKGVVELPAGRHYRLDYLEVNPEFRAGAGGSEVSLLLMAVVAARARELEAEGIVLETYEALVQWYENLGGIRGAVAGWTNPNKLVPFRFGPDATRRLAEMTDGEKE